MNKRRTAVDGLRVARAALGSLPPENARVLLRELTNASERTYVRHTVAQKKEWERKAIATGFGRSSGKANLSEWLRALADAACAK